MKDYEFDDADDIQVLVAWMAVKSVEIHAIAQTLKLRNVSAGNFGALCNNRQKDNESKPNVFIYPCREWGIILYNGWQYNLEEDNLLLQLSSRFTEAQYFLIDTGYRFSFAWKLARNGNMIRSFVLGEESYRDGAMTEAEDFIDWQDEERVQEIGSPEVLKIARQWSLAPIVENHPVDCQGIVGFI